MFRVYWVATSDISINLFNFVSLPKCITFLYTSTLFYSYFRNTYVSFSNQRHDKLIDITAAACLSSACKRMFICCVTSQ